MNKEIWIIRHGIRLDSTEKDKWIKLNRYKENPQDTPLSEKGIKYAYKSGLELIKKSKAIQNKEIKYIYCSPFTRCIQTAIQIIDAVKNKLDYDIKIIIVYNLGEGDDILPIIKFTGKKLNFIKPSIIQKLKYIRWIKKTESFAIAKNNIDIKLKPTYLKKKYKNYIIKFIGNDITLDYSWTDESKRISKAMININKKEKKSYIIVAHFGNSIDAYRYFNQYDKSNIYIKNKLETPMFPGKPTNEYFNVMIGFKEKKNGYDMMYKPNSKF